VTDRRHWPRVYVSICLRVVVRVRETRAYIYRSGCLFVCCVFGRYQTMTTTSRSRRRRRWRRWRWCLCHHRSGGDGVSSVRRSSLIKRCVCAHSLLVDLSTTTIYALFVHQWWQCNMFVTARQWVGSRAVPRVARHSCQEQHAAGGARETRTRPCLWPAACACRAAAQTPRPRPRSR